MEWMPNPRRGASNPPTKHDKVIQQTHRVVVGFEKLNKALSVTPVRHVALKCPAFGLGWTERRHSQFSTGNGGKAHPALGPTGLGILHLELHDEEDSIHESVRGLRVGVIAEGRKEVFQLVTEVFVYEGGKTMWIAKGPYLRASHWTVDSDGRGRLSLSLATRSCGGTTTSATHFGGKTVAHPLLVSRNDVGQALDISNVRQLVPPLVPEAIKVMPVVLQVEERKGRSTAVQ
jgi:hypothetical protein